MHGAKLVGGISSEGLVSFDLAYEVDNQRITLSSGAIIRFVKDLNSLFAKIQNGLILSPTKTVKLIIRTTAD